MTVTVGDLYDWVDRTAPFSTAMDFDNAGLLVGDRTTPVTGALVALDITHEVVTEAKKAGVQVILSHHPVIFQPLKRLSSKDVPYQLASCGIAAICAHTNLDFASQGVNTCLARALKLQEITVLKEYRDDLSQGWIGKVSTAMSPKEFARYVKEKLHCDGLKFTVGNREIQTVAVGSGASAGLLFDAAQRGADAFVTGDTKHHELLAAREMGITLVDAGHFRTEDIAMTPWMQAMQEAFPAIQFHRSAQGDPACYLA